MEETNDRLSFKERIIRERSYVYDVPPEHQEPINKPFTQLPYIPEKMTFTLVETVKQGNRRIIVQKVRIMGPRLRKNGKKGAIIMAEYYFFFEEQQYLPQWAHSLVKSTVEETERDWE